MGNYENARYELSVDLPPGQSAVQVFSNMQRILAILVEKKPFSEAALVNMKSYAVMTDKQWKDQWKHTWREKKAEAKKRLADAVVANDAWRERQKQARHALDSIGGDYKFTDAKENWEFDHED